MAPLPLFRLDDRDVVLLGESLDVLMKSLGDRLCLGLADGLVWTNPFGPGSKAATALQNRDIAPDVDAIDGCVGQRKLVTVESLQLEFHGVPLCLIGSWTSTKSTSPTSMPGAGVFRQAADLRSLRGPGRRPRNDRHRRGTRGADGRAKEAPRRDRTSGAQPRTLLRRRAANLHHERQRAVRQMEGSAGTVGVRGTSPPLLLIAAAGRRERDRRACEG